jgi:hypothetical protein
MSAWKRSPSGPSIGPAGDLRLPRPMRLGTLDRVNRGTVQGELRIPPRSAPCARPVSRRNQLAVLEHRLDPGDPQRPGPHRGDRLVPMRVEQRRTSARTPAPPLRHPATPSPAHDHIHPPAGAWFRLAASRVFNPREQHAGPGVIGSQSVRLSANCQRPARRSTDGQTILDPLPAARHPGSDLRFRGAPLRNRTVDLLLTMNPRQVPSLQVGRVDLEKHQPTRALASSG